MYIQQHELKRGFTLIELLVVITIIAILMGITVGIASLAMRKSRDSKVRSEMQAFSNSLEEYRVVYGFYPEGTYTEALDDMTNSFSKLPVEFQQDLSPLDAWGTPYIYSNITRHAFTLRSAGPNKLTGGADSFDDIESGTF